MTPDDPRVEDIAKRAMVARISTISRTGRPCVNPLWFIWQDGHVYLGTADWTLAARNVSATGSACVLLEVETDPRPRQIVRLTGPARILTRGRTGPKFYWRKTARKYFLDLDGLRHVFRHVRKLHLFIAYERQGANNGRGCLIEVRPETAEFLDVPH